MKRLLFIVSALLLLTVVSTEAKPKQLTPTITWELQKDGTLVIKGAGKMPDFKNRDKAPWINKASKITSIKICEGITHIGNYSFYNNTTKKAKEYSVLKFTTLPSTLRTIGKYAFSYHYTADMVVVIPKGVNTIGYRAFNGTTIEINHNIYKDIFSNNDFRNVIIGKDVTKIEDGAFEGCSGNLLIVNCDIPNGAFRKSKFSMVRIANSVNTIGEEAFKESKELKQITIPNSIVSIGKDAFEYCNNLKSVYISDLSAWCKIDFKNYTAANPLFNGANLYIKGKLATDITIPSDITVLKFAVFAHCKSLESVTIPKHVKTIGWYSFWWATNLKNVIIESGVERIAGYTFAYTNIQKLHIPNSITHIGEGAFQGCSSLTSITIPNSITHIGKGAFYCCNSLTSVTIPNSVTYIGEVSFKNTNIQELYIPNSVTYIGEEAFGGKKKLSWDLGEYNGKITNLPACVTRENYSKFGISKEAGETYMDNIGDPTAAVLRNKGKVYFDAKDYKTALSYYLKGVAAKKDGGYGYGIPDCYSYAGRCYEHLNNYVNAIKYYKTYYELQKYAYTANMIGELYLKLNDYNSAIEWYKKGDKSNKEIAELYLKKNNYSGAIEMLSKDAEKGDKDCQYMLAEVYKKSGNKNKAIFWYKKAAEQKHIKAEEALADYGIFLTQVQPQQQSQSNKSPERTTQNTTTQPYTPQPSTPQIQHKQVWVDCQVCNGGRCTKCDGYGNYYSSGGYWRSCLHCNHGRCMFCEGRGGYSY